MTDLWPDFPWFPLGGGRRTFLPILAASATPVFVVSALIGATLWLALLVLVLVGLWWRWRRRRGAGIGCFLHLHPDLVRLVVDT